jgi:hypothetical protein
LGLQPPGTPERSTAARRANCIAASQQGAVKCGCGYLRLAPAVQLCRWLRAFLTPSLGYIAWHKGRLALRIIRPGVSSALLRRLHFSLSFSSNLSAAATNEIQSISTRYLELQSDYRRDRYQPLAEDQSRQTTQGVKADFRGADQVLSPNEPLGVNPVQDECMCIVSTLSRAFRPHLSLFLTSSFWAVQSSDISSQAQNKVISGRTLY